MVVLKRKKNSRQRASQTHGWGAKSCHRGKGGGAGRGNAGSGKRADQKKPSYWGIPDYFGMHGFKSKGQKIKIIAVNIGDLPKYALKSGSNNIKLADFGINKLLGSGNAAKPYTIEVDYASEGAIRKIEEAKGSVKLLKAKQDEEDTSSKEK